jgi:hypothetical protein
MTVMGLELAYARSSDIIGPERAESLDVAEEVERLRLAWRPERVRVVLLAESHVWTSREETRSRVTQSDGVETNFARFVYCIGYGEPQVVTPRVTPNDGTPQYWKLFHDTIYEPTPTSHTRLLKTGEDNSQHRVRYKLNLLKEMRRAGVWLVDASVTALYHRGTNLAGSSYRKVLKASWDYHIHDVLSMCAPSAILIVGKGVSFAIGDHVRQSFGRGIEVVTINQPNARRSREDIGRDRRICFDLCSRHRTSH